MLGIHRMHLSTLPPWLCLACFPPPACSGFIDPKSKPVVLNKKKVDGIHLQGGTILGTSRGGANIK